MEEAIDFFRLKARNEEVEELQSRLRALVKKGDEERRSYEDRLKEQEKTSHEQQLDLNDRLIALSRQLDSLEEFRLNKEQLETKLKELNSALETERQQHQEQISKLERSCIQESEALRAEVEGRVSSLAGKFRQAAAAEMHSTTRRALHHNQTLTSVLETLRARLLHLREENHKLKDQLDDAKMNEKIQRTLAEQLALRCEKRAVLLRRVTEQAEIHLKQHQEDVKLLNESEQLRKDLRLQQAQLDATTELISQLKEKAIERDVALELTAVRLYEEDAIKKSLVGTIRMVLNLLQTSAFEDPHDLNKDETVKIKNDDQSTSTESDMNASESVLSGQTLESRINLEFGKENGKGTEYGVPFESLVRQIVELLTLAEEKAAGSSGSNASPAAGSGDHLLTYAGGDLGLVPRSRRARK